MFKQKNEEDSLGNYVEPTEDLKPIAAKNKEEKPICLKDINIEKDMKPVYKYECENCKKEFLHEVDTCDYCGSNFVRKKETDIKRCNVYIEKPVYYDKVYKFIVKIVSALFIILTCFPNRNTITRIGVLICWIFLIVQAVKPKKPKQPKQYKKYNYIFIKGLDYTADRLVGLLGYRRIEVKYCLDDKRTLILRSKEPYDMKTLEHNKKVDLLINVDDNNDYMIGFDLEKKFK